MADVQFDEAQWEHDLSLGGPTGRYMQKLALQVETAAKRLAPVDTGRLRSSIEHTVSGNGDSMHADIYSTVNYAIYQELGTRYQSGTPYLRPALHQVMS
jgi:HK97 gp10 family phage protein